MNILVTGGAGYIGSHTVVALYEAGFTPIIVDNYSNSDEKVLKALEKLLGHAPKSYMVDVCDTEALQRIWTAESPDAVIHFAASKAVGESVEKP
jgi:UDP-glucose 4-epimerase